MTFKLVVMKDKRHAILATTVALTVDQLSMIRDTVGQWKRDGGVLVIPECEVVARDAWVEQLDLGLPEDLTQTGGPKL